MLQTTCCCCCCRGCCCCCCCCGLMHLLFKCQIRIEIYRCNWIVNAWHCNCSSAIHVNRNDWDEISSPCCARTYSGTERQCDTLWVSVTVTVTITQSHSRNGTCSHILELNIQSESHGALLNRIEIRVFHWACQLMRSILFDITQCLVQGLHQIDSYLQFHMIYTQFTIVVHIELSINAICDQFHNECRS